MKTFNYLKQVLVFILLLLAMGCEKDEDNNENPIPEPEPEVIVPATTKVISPTEWASSDIQIDENQGTITINNPTVLPETLKVGDVVVSENEGGYLRKVTKIETNGGQQVLHTEDAALTDAFENLTLDIDVPVEEYDENQPRKHITTSFDEDLKTYRYRLSKTEADNKLKVKINDTLSRKPLVLLTGVVELKPVSKVKITIRNFLLKEVDMGFEIQQNLNLSVESGFEGKEILSKTLLDLKLAEIVVFVGGVPVLITPELAVEVGVDLSGSIKLKAAEVRQQFAYGVGVKYENEVWDSYSDFKNSFDFDYPKLEAKGKVRAFVNPELKLRFYKVVAPKMGINCGLSMEAKAEIPIAGGIDFDWELQGDMIVNFGVDRAKLDGSTINLFDSQSLIKIEFPIASSSDANLNKPPRLPVAVSPKLEQILSPTDELRYEWQATDANNDPLTYTLKTGRSKTSLSVSADGLSDSYYVPMISPALGEHYWQVVVSDGKDTTEGPIWSFVVQQPNLPPEIPSLSSPENGVELAFNTPLEFKWAATDPDGDALTYDLLFGTEANESSLDYMVTELKATSYAPPASYAPNTYYWQIIANDPKGGSAKSPIWSFSIAPDVSLPTVSTGEALSITETTADLKGTIGADGGSVITKRGFYWATHNNPGSGDSETVVSGAAPTFIAVLSSLQPGTTYYYRAFATNSVGTSTGEVKSFTTTGDGGNTGNNPTGTMTDIDGNTYNTVKIGDQWWMAENLKVTKYANGTSIPHITGNSEWADLGDNNTDKAYCFYTNNASLGYGALYTFAAATNGTPHSGSGHVQGVCPEGWHLPSDNEWTQLEEYMIANGYNYDGSTSGNKIAKALASTTGWNSSSDVGNVGNDPSSNNSSGFSAPSGGYRQGGININDSFYNAGRGGSWWSSSQFRNNIAYSWGLWYDNEILTRSAIFKAYGRAVRCVRD